MSAPPPEVRTEAESSDAIAGLFERNRNWAHRKTRNLR
jgi:hypothetical protein